MSPYAETRRVLRLRRGAALVLALLAFFLWRLGDIRRGELARCRSMAVLHTSAALTAEDYDRMLEAEGRADTPVGFALWTQLDRQYLETTLTGRTAAAAVLPVSGEIRLVLPTAPALSAEDFTGCLIDAQTALELYGSKDAVGASLLWGEEEYVVRGVIASPAHTVVLRPKAGVGAALDCISVSDSGEAEAFARRHGVNAGLTVENSVYAYIAGFFAALPLWAVAVLLLGALLRAARQNRGYPVRRAVVLLLLAALATGLFIWLLASLPPAWTPSRWSDLDFWSRTLKSAKSGALELAAAKKYRPDLALLGVLAHSAALCTGALLLVPPAAALLRPPKNSLFSFS